MAIWRSPDLEAVFGGPLDEAITESSLDQLRRDGVSESEQLEFKRASYGPDGDDHPEREFAKDVSAFANHRGGLLLIGVKERQKVATELTPVQVTPENEERRLRRALVNYQAPLAVCSFVWARATEGGLFIAIVVPPSVRAPHAVIERDGPSLCYPVRHGDDTRWLSEHEVAERYRRRLTAQQDERARVNRTVEEGGEALRTADGVWLYAAVVPEMALPGRMDQDSVQAINDWHRAEVPRGPLGDYLTALGRGIPAPGRVTFTRALAGDEQDETQVRDAYVALYVDGAAFAAEPTGEPTADDESGRELGELSVFEVTVLLVDVTTRWCAHQAGAWGIATLVLGLIDADTADGRLEDPLPVRVARQGVSRQLAPRSANGHPRAEVAVDLAAVETMQQRLAVCYQALAGLGHWFGLAEPRQLDSDGAIVARGFPVGWQQAEQWAQDHGVATHPGP